MRLRVPNYHILAVKRLVIAGTTFKEAELLCSHIETLGEETLTLLHVPLLAGVCVTYMKPFVRGDGLGPLPPAFRRFEPANKKHGKVHADLGRLRHWFYAHRDMLNIPRLFADPEGARNFEEVTFHLEGDGTYWFSAHELSWPLNAVISVRELCVFQRHRVDEAIDKHLHHLCSAKMLVPGTYVLGRDLR
jgi:hypothetical protein